jgi:hypothetical protein
MPMASDVNSTCRSHIPVRPLTKAAEMMISEISGITGPPPTLDPKDLRCYLHISLLNIF